MGERYRSIYKDQKEILALLVSDVPVFYLCFFFGNGEGASSPDR
ncbi:hypothetical protein B4168_1737 [Anoxybacillus flavithermus]|nr:hypothetical protein B4168_1737 [Anoxybacillus flavithermus]OAO87833.1 hypothetical protein GT23_0890 [Parageobacillus thermoglucosidasius]